MSLVAVTVLQELKMSKDKALPIPEGLENHYSRENNTEFVEPCNTCKHRYEIVDESTGTGFCFKCIHYWKKFEKE